MPSNEWLMITIGAILVNNIVLSRILGICPFLGVSKKMQTALGMSGAVIFVMTITSFATSLLYHTVLANPISFQIGGFAVEGIDLKFTKLLLFIVLIASTVQLIEILLKKFSPPLYASLGIYLPLITTNCVILGAVEINAQASRPVLESTIYGICVGIGFGLALMLFASLRERMELSKIPKAFQGTAIALISAGILAMAFMGFSGLVK